MNAVDRVNHLLVALGLAALTLIFTYPLCLHMTSLLLGSDGDNMLWLGWLNWYGAAFSNGYPLLNDIEQFYPHGANLLVYLNGFSLDAILVLPLILAGQDLLAYNLMAILSIWLSGFAAYLMCYDLVKSRLSAIFGGIAFGFGAFQMAHALGHLSIFGPFWLPLILLVLNRIVQDRATIKTALLGGLFSMFAALTNGYWGVVVFFILLFYSLVWILPRVLSAIRNGALRSGLASKSCIMTAFALPLVALSLVLLALRLPAQPGWGPLEYLSWGASPLDYLLPSFLHPLFGPMLLNFYANFPLGPYRWGNLIERDLYLGITPIILTLYVILLKRDSNGIRLGLIGFGLFILSLGPFLKVLGLPYGVEPYTLFSWLPYFRAVRVVARFGLGTLLFCSLVSAIGMNYLLHAKKIRKPQWSRLIGVLLIGILLIEIVPAIPYPLTDPTRHNSAVYVWLSNQPGTFGVLEYPVTTGDTYAGYHMSVAGKYSTSGFVNIPPADLVSYLASISFLQPDDNGQLRPANTTLLTALDIRYILVHEDEYTRMYGPSTLAAALVEANSTIGLRYLTIIDQTVIYEVV